MISNILAYCFVWKTPLHPFTPSANVTSSGKPFRTPQAQLHSLCCVSIALHTGLLQLLGWAVGAGENYLQSLPSPSTYQRSILLFNGDGDASGKVRRLFRQRVGQRGKERDTAVREAESLRETPALCLTEKVSYGSCLGESDGKEISRGLLGTSSM